MFFFFRGGYATVSSLWLQPYRGRNVLLQLLTWLKIPSSLHPNTQSWSGAVFGWGVLNDSDPFSISLSVVLSNEARSIEHFRLSKIEFWLFGDHWAKVELFHFRDLAKVKAVAKSTKHSNYSEVHTVAFSILPSTPPFSAHPHPLNRTSHVFIKGKYFPLVSGMGIHPQGISFIHSEGMCVF